MNTKTTWLVTIMVVTVTTWSAHAHHNSAPLYVLSESITIEGTVTEFRFVNPHARIYVTVVDANGKPQEWLAEGENAGLLRSLGWTGNELKRGDRITITGAPGRDGARRVEWRVITRADGTQLGGGNSLPRERQQLRERLEQQRRNQNRRDDNK
jgi:hypothetical protein